MFANLKHADPIIFIPGAGEKRLDRTEAAAAAAAKRPPIKGVATPAPVRARRASPVRRPAVVPVGLGAPVAAPHYNNRPAVAAIVINPAEARLHVWGIIQRIAWCNVSDGNVDVVAWHRTLSERDREIFKNAFAHWQTGALNHREVQTVPAANRADLATHIVMMGREFYEQCMEDPGWIRFLIEQDDYQKQYQTIMDTFDM